MEWPFEDSVIAPARCQYLGGLRQVSPEGWYALNQYPIDDVVSPIARIYGSRHQGVEIGETLFLITPSDPLAKFLLPVPTGSAGLEV